ncbi:MAG: hypothetical protein K1X88_05365 [Nannocystaceae bacterium]|nr:hypothetical protein [Nannocystaceae bacterium]
MWTTTGVVDPETGTVLEPEGSQFLVALHATGEGPSSPCFVWDYDAGEYRWDPTLPGCGPVLPGGG